MFPPEKRSGSHPTLSDTATQKAAVMATRHYPGVTETSTIDGCLRFHREGSMLSGRESENLN